MHLFFRSRELLRKSNPDSSNEFCHHILILRKFEYGKIWAYGKTIRLWKKNSPMEGQFDNGKSILEWKNNLIMEKQFDYGTKFDFEKKIDFEIKFPFFFCFCIHDGLTRR